MNIENVFKLTSAAHYSYMVDSPSLERGGILLVSSPGNLKSTIVRASLKPFPDTLVYSDLTLKQLSVVRNQIANGVYHTLGFLELEKIYARQLSVSMNFEGVIKAMVEEGFSHFAFEDQRCWVPQARCFVLASVLDNLYRYHFGRWHDNGFLRRFIVFKYTLSRLSKQKIKNSIHEGELIQLPPIVAFPSTTLKMDITREESQKCEYIIGSDDEIYTPLNILRKVLVVLKWRYKQERVKNRQFTPMETLEDLKQAIGPDGGILEL